MNNQRTVEDVRRALEIDAKRRKKRVDKRITHSAEEYEAWLAEEQLKAQHGEESE